MQYRHTATGVIIESPCELSGGWEPVKKQEPAPSAPKKETAKKPAQKRNTKK